MFRVYTVDTWNDWKLIAEILFTGLELQHKIYRAALIKLKIQSSDALISSSEAETSALQNSHTLFWKQRKLKLLFLWHNYCDLKCRYSLSWKAVYNDVESKFGSSMEKVSWQPDSFWTDPSYSICSGHCTPYPEVNTKETLAPSHF